MKLNIKDLLDFVASVPGGVTTVEVAEKFGTSRPAVNRLLSDLRNAGALLVVGTKNRGTRGRPEFLSGVVADMTADLAAVLLKAFRAKKASAAKTAAPTEQALVLTEPVVVVEPASDGFFERP
jgi:predicted ArsR family transcriptional regulator